VRFLTIAAKELRLFFRDRMALFWMLALPLIFVTVFGLAFSGNQTEINVLVVQQDNGPLADAYVLALDNALNVVKVNDVATAENEVLDGKAVAAIIVPAGFSENTAQVRLVYDETKQQASAIVMGVVDGITFKFTGQQPPVTAESVSGKQFSTFQFIIPGMSVMFIFMMCGIGGTELILSEKEKGTFKRNLLAPISRASFLGGKLLANFLIGCIQLIVLFAFGIFVFGMAVYGNILLVALIGVPTILFAVGLGLLVSSLVRSHEAANGLIMAIVFPMCALGGVWFSLEMMPGYMQSIAQVLPTYHAQSAFTGVIMRGKDLAAIAPSVLVLAGFAIAVLVAGILLFKWEE